MRWGIAAAAALIGALTGWTLARAVPTPGNPRQPSGGHAGPQSVPTLYGPARPGHPGRRGWPTPPGRRP